MNDEIKINKANKSLTFINNGIAFSQFGIADEILDLITNLQQENERLKEELNCKEYFSSIMPEDTEFVILTKNNYDRQQKDIQLELIDYKSRCEKAIEYIKDFRTEDYILVGKNSLLNILQNGSDSQ